MNNKQFTKAIVLTRIEFGDADRIITLLTPFLGKIHLVAKGARKEKSKLAGGIELLSEVEVGYITGKGELGTLISARLIRFYGSILKDINKVQLVYQILKTFDNITEDNVENDYYVLLLRLLTLADDSGVDSQVLGMYYKAQLLNLTGQTPNFRTDINGLPLTPDDSYDFDLDSMCFRQSKTGKYSQKHLKYLRLLFSSSEDSRIFKLHNAQKVAYDLEPLVEAMTNSTLYI